MAFLDVDCELAEIETRRGTLISMKRIKADNIVCAQPSSSKGGEHYKISRNHNIACPTAHFHSDVARVCHLI